MGHDYNEKFIDDETLAETSSGESDFNDEFFNSEELSVDTKKIQRDCKVGVRRRVEEILAEKANKKRNADPFEDF